MYKMIMIDDEIETRSRIKNIMDFNQYGVKVDGLFDNALDALDYIELHKDIDLVVTDIKMPFMDGLELSAILREKFPLVKIVIISGYDDFDYAKRALECGAIGYIMKPITQEDFIGIIQKAIKQMEDEKKVYNSIETLEKYKIRSKEFLTESTLNVLIKEPFNNSVLESIQLLDLDFTYPYYLVVSILLNGKKNMDEFAYYGTCLNKVIDETINIPNHIITHKNKLVVILKLNEVLSIRKIDFLMNTIVLKMKKYYNCDLFVGVSDILPGIENIETMYHMADHALMQKNLFIDESINYYSNIAKSVSQLKIEDNLLDDLRFYIRYKSMDMIEYELNRLKGIYMKAHSIAEQHYFLLDFSLSLMRCCNNANQLLQSYNMDLYTKLKEYKDADELFSELKKIILLIRDINEEGIKSRFDGTIQKIIDYINSNYQNPDLNLNNLADEMDLSVSYICSLLKKEKNETFVKILTDIRMTKAKELLRNPDNKIIDIAEAVGFVEPYYFSHTFKKATGYSPKEYRALCLNE